MARPKGALNKKTRRALFDAAQEYEDHGKAALNYLARIMLDTQKDDGIRMRAADILLPFTRPKLSAVEQTNIDPVMTQTKEELDEAALAVLAAMVEQDSKLKPLADAYIAKYQLRDAEPGVKSRMSAPFGPAAVE